MKNDFVIPILVLSLICLFVSGALAFVNELTNPVIENASAQRAAAARKEIIPQADGFELINIEGLPRTILEVHRTTNNTGYIFMMSVQGYGGKINMICGIDNDGRIIKTQALSHTETKGMTDPVFSDPHESQYIGKDKNLHGINAVSGATISSNAYKKGVSDALTAFEIMQQGRR